MAANNTNEIPPTTTTTEKPTWAVNDRILCATQEKVDQSTVERLYDAKILSITKDDDGELIYRVHYQGWNSRFDEWISADRMSVFDADRKEESEKAWEEAKKAAAKSKGSKGASGGSSGKTPKSSGKSKSTAGSSGPSTPHDGSTMKSGGLGDGGLELESRASTPSVDGSVSVASSSTLSAGQQSTSKRRKSAAKATAAAAAATTPSVDGSTPPENPETPVTSDPKRRRGARASASTTGAAAAAAAAVQPASGTGSVSSVPNDFTSPAVGVESYELYRHRKEIQIKIPDDLKSLLVDDWELITHQMKLVRLPADKTIDDIIDDYLKAKNGKSGSSNASNGNNPANKATGNNATLKQQMTQEAMNGVRSFFNRMCGVHLLYRFERPQFKSILAQQRQDENDDGVNSTDEYYSPKLTAAYGLPHLMRLFTRIGNMMAYTNFDQKSIDQIHGALADFMAYLVPLKEKLFNPDEHYITAPPDYQRNAFQ